MFVCFLFPSRAQVLSPPEHHHVGFAPLRASLVITIAFAAGIHVAPVFCAATVTATASESAPVAAVAATPARATAD